MKIIAIKHCGTGNDSVGRMWKETKIFDPETPVSEIIKWVTYDNKVKPFNTHLELTVAEEEEQ